MDIALVSSCNTGEKSVIDRNLITCNIYLSKVNLKYNYLNNVDSQCIIKYSNKEW